MLDKKVEKELNAQIQKEMYSCHLYLAMSAWAESVKFSGMGHWLREQAREEIQHAMKIYGYVHERGGRVVIEALDKPQKDWKSPLDAFTAALKHEEFISDSINKLVDAADSKKDKATANFLQWFVAEQVEEESSAQRIVDMLELIGDHSHGLIMLDRELNSRGR